MPAEKCNLTGDYRIEQGCPFTITLTCTDNAGNVYDLTGATCAATIKETYDSSSSTAFSSSINTTTGVITLTLTTVQTAAINYSSGVWDCFLTETGPVVTRLAYGTVAIDRKVT